MKICQIKPDVFPLYKVFLPQESTIAGLGRRNEISLGFFDETGVHGAAVVRMEFGVAEIISLRYEIEVLPGVIEGLLTDTLLKLKNQFDLARISYVAEGEEKQLDEYDYVMLDLGYAPRRGETQLYTASLSEIMDSLGDETIKKLSTNADKNSFRRVGDVTKSMIEKFNDKFYENPYRSWEQDDQLSLICVKDNEPLACIYCNKDEDGRIVFSWMNYDEEVGNLTRMKMIMALINNAIELNSKETEVIICPFMSEVETLIQRFGFKKPDDYQATTRIYTYYISED